VASLLVKQAVAARLAANWSATPIAGLNQEGDAPVDGSAFIAVQYPVANEAHVGMAGVGQRTFRETGVIRIVISTPRGQGTDLGDSYADTLRALFRAQDFGASGSFGGVRCLAPSPPVEDDSNDHGNYYVQSFAVPYYADILA